MPSYQQPEMAEELSLVLPLYGMLEFQHGKVKLKGGFRIADLHFIVQQVGKDVASLLHKAFLLELVSSVGQLGHRVGQFPYFGEGFHNGQCGLRGFRTFEDSGKHIQAFLVEGFGYVLGMLTTPSRL